MPALLLALLLTGTGRGYRITHPVPPASVSWWGHSIPAGACGAPAAAELGLLLPAGYAEFNAAHAGETADQVAGRIFTEAATACHGGLCGVYVVGPAAVNTLKLADFALTDDATVAAYALNGDGSTVRGVLDGVDQIHVIAPNAAVVLVGELPYAGCDALTCSSLVDPGGRARQYNADMLAACASRPWLVCLSPYADFEDIGHENPDDDNPDFLKPSLACADGIHLLTAGHAQLAAAVHAARAWR